MSSSAEPTPEDVTPDGISPEWIAPGRTALLMIDMQADFASPQGAMGRAGADLAAVPAALAAADRLVSAARAAGVLVVFAGLTTTVQNESDTWKERLRRRGEAAIPLCRAGTPGAAFVGPAPAGGDLVIHKTRYSAFFGAGLDDALRARRIDTLIVCGLTTECCVDCTVREAFHLDYHVFIAADACAAYDAELHAAALRTLDCDCAIVARAAEVIEAWETFGVASEPHPR